MGENFTERMARLREKANNLPLRPGIYIMHGADGKVIYVGKSKVLKNRVSQYFHENRDKDEKTRRMVRLVHDFEYILTDNEIEALTLENKLIKLHQPKYNIKLKDDKTYPYIKVDMNSPYPTITVTRTRLSDKAKYFGPYSGTRVAYGIVKTIQKVFGIASCDRKFPEDIGKIRPCLYAQMGVCIAPCTGKISSDEYKEIFSDILSFLRGNFTNVKKSLQEKMNFAAENLMFETAAKYRDRINYLSKLWDKQKVVGDPSAEFDIIALYNDERAACLSVSYVRNGALIDTDNFVLDEYGIIDDESLSLLICDLYTKREYIPSEILIGFELVEETQKEIEEYLKTLGGSAKLRHPERGDKKALCDMVLENAKLHAEQSRIEREKTNYAQVRLSQLLSLEVVPERIEAIDISNIGNEKITAGLVSFIGGKPNKKGYRTYNIQETKVQDDYTSMREAVRRRIDGAETNPLPDLLLLDGGKGHVNVIKELFCEKQVDLPVFGMVKDEYHKTRTLTDGENFISIAGEQAVFNLIYKIQEEVHRFALSKMTQKKRKTLKKSSLTEIKGIGEAKAKALLSHFKGLSNIKTATKEELMQVKGITEANAEELIKHFSEKTR